MNSLRRLRLSRSARPHTPPRDITGNWEPRVPDRGREEKHGTSSDACLRHDTVKHDDASQEHHATDSSKYVRTGYAMHTPPTPEPPQRHRERGHDHGKEDRVVP